MSIDYTKRRGGGTAPAQPSAGPVSLSKRGESVSLTKDASGEPYRFNLNWDQRQQSGGGGFFSKLRGTSLDLDLGCLFELTDGRKGSVQALGNTFGALDRPPYIQLDQDDRSGAASGGENLLISSAHQDRIQRILVYAFIYEGAPNWSQAGAVATIHQPGGQPITIALDEHRDGQIMCAIALLDNTGGGMRLSREVQYFKGHQQIDTAYKWGMDWRPARK